MRHLGLVVAGLVFAAVSLGAQQGAGKLGIPWPTCPTCKVVSFVDGPDGATVSAASMAIEGWGFECASGQAIDRVDVFFEDYDGYFHPLKQAEWTLHAGLYRPDVRDHWSAHCPNVSTNAGWRLTLSNPPPVGLRRIIVNVWRGGLFEGHGRVYLVKP